MSCTIVSCYYNIPSKRSHEKYIEWINNLLSNINENTNLFIFVDKNSYDIIGKYLYRLKNLHIHVIEFTDLFIHKKYDTIWDSQYAIDPQSNIRTKECYIIWNSKFWFLKTAIEINKFDSDKFIWCDIGSYRFADGLFLANFPEYNKISNDKLDISLIENYTEDKEYFFNEVHISGAIFGGGKNILLELCEKYYEIFDDYVSKNKFIGCDQQLISTLYMKNKHLFNFVDDNIFYDNWFELYAYYNGDKKNVIIY